MWSLRFLGALAINLLPLFTHKTSTKIEIKKARYCAQACHSNTWEVGTRGTGVEALALLPWRTRVLSKPHETVSVGLTETVQQVGASAVHPEDRGQFPVPTSDNSQRARESDSLSWLTGTFAWYGTTPTHMNKNKIYFLKESNKNPAFT